MVGVALPLRKTLIAAVASLLTATAPAYAADATSAGPGKTANPTDVARERGELFLKFKSALESNDLVGARMLAEQLVASTEAAFGKDSRELVAPLTNLGTVAFRRGEYPLAQTHYAHAVKLIDGQQAGADRELIRPLTGLGETFLVTNRPAEAAMAFKRALDLSRNLDGLFNAAQIDIIDPLLECYAALGKTQEAEKEHQYAFRVAESAYGKNDLRMLDALDRFALWHESNGRYTTARGLHARALQIVEQYATRQPLLGITALRGLARTYLNEVLVGPENSERPADMTPRDPFGFMSAEANRLNPDGERSLKYALEVLTNGQPVDHRARADVLLQLGDWYLVGGSLSRAAAEYKRAWLEVAPLGEEALAPLRKPRLLAYKPPSISMKRSTPNEVDDEHEIFDVTLALKVGRDGKVLAATPTVATQPESATRPVMMAAKRARFAPALTNGEPVDADGVPFDDRVMVKSKAKPNDAAKDGSAPPRST